MGIFDIFEQLTKEPKAAEPFARPRLPTTSPPPPQPPQGPIVGMTPGGAVRGPAAVAGTVALGAGLTAQPDEAQSASMGELFKTFENLLLTKFDKPEPMPRWATQTELPQ